MKDLISVIVPIYNSENYIKRCIDSIINQTYKNIEVILVDDGSTDESYKICCGYMNLDNRIKVIQKKNGGVSSARNTGLNLATGKYIGFIDSDDWIDITMYEVLYNQIISNNADIGICGYALQNSTDQTLKKNLFPKKNVLNQTEALDMALSTHYFQGFVCNKLFKAELFTMGGIRLNEEIYIYEDLLCVCECILRSKTIVFIGDHLYHYISRDDSALKSEFNIKKATILDAVYQINILCSGSYPQLYQNLNNISVYANLYLIQNMAKSNFIDGDLYDKINENLSKIFIEVLKSKELSYMEKLYVVLIVIDPKLYIWIRALIKKYR